jgi:hypothetical protein
VRKGVRTGNLPVGNHVARVLILPNR